MSKEKMARNNVCKWLILILLAAFSFKIAYPPQDKIRLGLDLEGGTSFTLGVDREKLAEKILADAGGQLDPAAVSNRIEQVLKDCDDRIVSVIRRRVDAMGTNEPVIQSLPKDHRLLVQLPGADEKVRKEAKSRLQSMAYLEFRLTHPKDAKLAADLLSRDACPEGYVKGGRGYMRAENWSEVVKTPGYAARLASFGMTDGRYRFMLADNKDGTYTPHFVSRQVELTGDNLEKAEAQRDVMKGAWEVAFTLDSVGATKFATLTRNYKANGPKNRTNEGRCLAIVLDDTLISAPQIQSEIDRGSGVITGGFDQLEAKQLASDLNAGALPAPLKVLSESSVAPTVGEDAIKAGKMAALLGFVIVAFFMFAYYRFMGFVADVALFLDVVLLPTALVFVANILGVFAHDPSMGGGYSLALPVLTMPGIAGLVLTLGMAVDANVLIFERIREELARAQSVGTAIKNGYGRAFTAIFDSNLTTILIGVILFVVGTGPVRGFAVMLTAGVVVSMFTAVVVTRLVFDYTVKPDAKPFKMLQFFKNPNVDFMKYGNKTMLFSAVLLAVTLAIFAFRLATNPAAVLAVDLTGGTSIVYNLTQDEAKQPTDGAVRDALAKFDSAAVIQYQRGVGSTTLLVKTGESAETVKGRALENKDVGAHVTKLLVEKFPEADISLASVDEVGSLVGSDLKESGTKAVLFSLVAILVYVGFRFKFGFGLGGIVALAHDALISLALFSLMGRQISLIVITAILTIIGYSINDTVVVFDRIREQLQRDARTPFRDLCNKAINDCLSRTVITSLTTFFAVAALFAFGDGSIYDFALTMLIGLVAGTYSSVFIATPVMAWWYRGKRPSFDEEEENAEKQA